MIKKLYASVTGMSGIISINIDDSHSSPTSVATISAANCSLNIGDYIVVDMGYTDNHTVEFTGYVKNIEIKEPERVYTVTANNVLIRAVDYFVAASNPEEPFKRSNIAAENLVRDVLELAGLTNYTADPTSFTFAISSPAEVNLTSAYDYCKFIADILAWHLYADTSGLIHFVDRKPYPVVSDPSVYTLDDPEILTINYTISDRDLRNRVVVYGTNNIHAEASASSPYLPAGFYRSVVVAAPGVIDSQSMAQQAANYNLTRYNRLTYRTSISMTGNVDFSARQCITVNKSEIGVSGKWYVFGKNNVWSKQGFITNLELRQ